MEATRKNAHLRPALFIALVMIAVHSWIHVKGQALNGALLLAATLPLIVGIIYNVYQHASAHAGNTFGNNFAYGFRITAVITVIMVIFVAVFFKAFPQYKDLLVDALRNSVDRKTSGMDDETVDKAVQEWDAHFTQRIVTIYIFLHLISGTVASLLAAAIASRKTKTN
ncbi:DUF4199 family protein [Flaviaesturariibacter aridisoli]|uniref:DUF4199 family protein n=1 Tax=Flaviaesturariibacter aridisoli TaxID=2545761 RepID=A0A4R4E1T7_9BACT|nr:DUF4199 family protein [Flaviaesturariibacter aridisoli]TCZ69027.1 DUF4199 family protein [Flaviaesturariibacter aridisoli]